MRRFLAINIGVLENASNRQFLNFGAFYGTQADFWKNHANMDEFFGLAHAQIFYKNLIGTHKILMDEFSRNRSSSCLGNWNFEKNTGWVFQKYHAPENLKFSGWVFQDLPIRVKLLQDIKVGCVFPMVVVSILPHAEFGQNDHREDAPHFSNEWESRNCDWVIFTVTWFLNSRTPYLEYRQFLSDVPSVQSDRNIIWSS